jgi:hypothetical protein
MSSDLLVTVPKDSSFSLNRCAQFMTRYDLCVEFPKGLDFDNHEGYLPCRILDFTSSTGDVQDRDCGFELTTGLPDPPEGNRDISLSVSGNGNGLDLMLAHAFAAYCVSELKGVLEDPQEGSIYTFEDSDTLDQTVHELLAAAQRKSASEARNRANAIVVAAAKEALSGSGFVPDKQGRFWYEDNGWFVSIIDFQSIRGRPGSFLNVFAHMLWTPDEDYIPMDYGGRIGDNRNIDGTTIEYIGNDDLFRQQANFLAQRALEEAQKLRALRNWSEAKRLLLNYCFVSDELWGNWHRAMLCFITSDSRAPEYFEAFAANTDSNNDYIRRFIAKQSTIFGVLFDNYPQAQALIGDIITVHREVLSKDELLGLDKTYRLDVPPPGSVPEVPVERRRPVTGWRRFFTRG